ncbi:MAG: pilus (MSHA type) biogenesis protein MshL [Alteromonadaceae bacterium]|nr:pilus (MSHA type) biogenesis protein MshL [Alteromonadaceae bacterium]
MKNNNLTKSSLSRYLCSVLVSSILVSMSLAGCKSVPDSPTFVKNALDEAIANSSTSKKATKPKPLVNMPSAVQNEIMQHSMQQAKQSLLAEKRLQIAANEVDAKSFFAAIVDESAYSVAMHPDVSGNITLNLKDVTLDEVITVVEDLYGYEIQRKGKIIQVYPAGMRTETIPLNYLYITRNGSSSTSVNSGGLSSNDSRNRGSSSSSKGNSNNSNLSNNGSDGQSGANQNGSSQNSSGINIYTNSQSDYWVELQANLLSLLGVGSNDEARTVIVSPQAGLVTVRAMPNEIKVVKKFIRDSAENLRRQVIIEAKIMEVTLNDDYQQGINWDEVLGHVGSTDIAFSTAGGLAGNTISTLIGGTTSIGFKNKDFAGVINLLSTQGNVQVLSSPRITVTNNQKAVIKVGNDEYFVTDVSSTTTTGTSTTVTPEVDLTPFFSGIALDVTPQISESGEVILHVHPAVTITEEQVKLIQLGGDEIVLPMARSSVRESDTIIRAKSGEIVIIGGLIETRKVDSESKTPLLGDIPWVGELFKSKRQKTEKKELVILLKPIVIGQDTWKNQLKDARALLKQWFPESK